MDGYTLKKQHCILLSEDLFYLNTNSVDTDEMPHYLAFNLGLHCLQKYLFRGYLNSKGFKICKLFGFTSHANK